LGRLAVWRVTAQWAVVILVRDTVVVIIIIEGIGQAVLIGIGLTDSARIAGESVIAAVLEAGRITIGTDLTGCPADPIHEITLLPGRAG